MGTKERLLGQHRTNTALAPEPGPLAFPRAPRNTATARNDDRHPPTGPTAQIIQESKHSKVDTQLPIEQLPIQFLKAVKRGDTDKIMELFQTATDQGFDDIINVRGMWESTPLIYACQYGHATVAMWLLHHEADPNAYNEKGVTPLLLASLEGLIEVVDYLLHLHVSNTAARAEDLDVQVGVVYNSVVDLNVYVNPVVVASMNGHLNVVKSLLISGACPDGCPNTSEYVSEPCYALLAAAKYGHLDVLKTLLFFGADTEVVDSNGNHALLMACEAGHEQCALRLLAELHGRSVAGHVWKRSNAHGFTALHHAAAHGLVSVCQAIIQSLLAGSDKEFINRPTISRQETALLMVCRKKRSTEAIGSLLLKAGADAELPDRGGTTAKQVLERSEQTALLELWQSCSGKKRCEGTE